MVVMEKPKTKKFSPKFEEAEPKKTKKIKKNIELEESSPKKKNKKNESQDKILPKPKKFIKSNENVDAKEAKAEWKNMKEKKEEKKRTGKVNFEGKNPKSKHKEPVELLNKKETREKQKQMKETRKKFKQEDVFDIGVKAKKVWEEVRREDCPESKKESLVNQLHSLVQGNIKKIIFAHDTVRVVECLMALGSSDIRDKLFVELKGDILEMVKSKYAHFFVQKMLRYGSKEQKNQIIKVVEGQIAKLMKNKTAGHVIETIYNDIASAGQRNSMLQEFLDHGFIHFKEPELRTVPEIIAKYPLRKADCIQNLQRNVEVLIRKGAFNHSLVHTVIYNYLLVADSKQRAETIEQLRDSLVHMAHSREGAYAALMCLWHGTTKDRKAIIKSFKTFMLKTAQEEYGHLVLLGVFDCADDTKMVGKIVISELMQNMEEMFTNKYCVRVLKYLFCSRDSVYINKDMITILEKGDGNEHSKKSSELRHKELLELASPAVINHIIEGFAGNLYDPPTSITLTCIINHAPPCKELTHLFTNLAKLAAKPFAKGDSAPNLVENTASSMLLKKVILKDKERAERGEETFASHLLTALEEESIESYLGCNRGCFLLVNLVDTGLKEVKDILITKVKPYVRTLKSQDTAGAKMLVTKLEL